METVLESGRESGSGAFTRMRTVDGSVPGASGTAGVAAVERDGNVGAFGISELGEEDVELPVADVDDDLAVGVLRTSVGGTKRFDGARSAGFGSEEVRGKVA